MASRTGSTVAVASPCYGTSRESSPSDPSSARHPGRPRKNRSPPTRMTQTTGALSLAERLEVQRVVVEAHWVSRSTYRVPSSRPHAAHNAHSDTAGPIEWAEPTAPAGAWAFRRVDRTSRQGPHR